MDHPRRLYNLFSAVASSRVMEATIDLETGETIETGAAASITGNPAVDEVIRTLPATELSKLLLRIRDWNATAKTSGIAQLILHAVVKLRPAEDLRRGFNQRPTNLDNEMALDADNEGVSGDKAGQQSGSNTTTKRGEGLQEVVEALIPYTERHLARTDRLVQDTYILDFLLSEMDGGIAPEDTDDMMQLDA
jgi:U3 small nucleolar RNA-associated protein 13